MLGIVTKFDFLRAFGFTTGQLVPSYDELMKRTVGEVMTEGVVNVEPATPLTRVLQLMVSLKIRSFPVLGPDRELLGMISRGDVMRALKQATQEARQHAPTRLGLVVRYPAGRRGDRVRDVLWSMGPPRLRVSVSCMPPAALLIR